MKRLWLLAALGLSGCATQTLQVTGLPYSPESMELIGPAWGQVTQDYIMCIPFVGFNEGDSLDAISKALKPHAADALLNPLVQTENFFFFPFFCRKTVTASGIAIKFNRPPLPGDAKPK